MNDVVRVQIRLLDPDLPPPRYAHPGDAGADLVAAEGVDLPPGGRALVRTGVRQNPLAELTPRELQTLALLAEAHEDQATDAERRGDVEQAMGWFADSMRLRDVIQVVSSIEIPLPATGDSPL